MERSHEHLDTYKISFPFNNLRLKITVPFISHHLLQNQYAIPLQALELNRLS